MNKKEKLIYCQNHHHDKEDNFLEREHVRVFYFIDDNGQIQIINLEKKLDSVVQNSNKHYIQHIKTKIGHPHLYDKQDYSVVATYVKNNLAYQDVKFIGIGLIENFVDPDPAFSSRIEQMKNSNYIVAQTNLDQILCVYRKHNQIFHKPSATDTNRANNEF